MEAGAKAQVKSKKPLIIGILSVILVITVAVLVFVVVNRKAKTPGLYGDDGKMLESWDSVMQLIGLELRNGEFLRKDKDGNIITAERIDYLEVDLKYDSSTQQMILPEGVTSIGCAVFFNCNSLTSIELPDSVTSIGSMAFWLCENLTNIIWNGSTYSSADDFLVAFYAKYPEQEE